nr:MAG TPA: hypothetical protein [Caudoviricetes sp.]
MAENTPRLFLIVWREPYYTSDGTTCGMLRPRGLTARGGAAC